MTSIDLNCDLGEIPGLLRDGTDEALMRSISSANLACGGHAGDAASMEQSVRSAMRHGVALGAHPSYPDRAGFGRHEVSASPSEVAAFVLTQIRDLEEVTTRCGARLVHVKPHGALYHAASRDAAIAAAIAGAAARIDPGLVLVGLAGSPMLSTWSAHGRHVAGEAFADRRYEADGALRARSQPDALIPDPAAAAEQAVRIATGRGAVASDGTVVPIQADTLCLHGDTPGAVAIARAVRAALESAGVQVRALDRRL
jgi:5-oxoprolinase (ATP-hydrolysing) subunit A